jgi:uncharacterized protein
MTNTTLTRMRDRAVTERPELDRLLDDAVLAHIAMVDDNGEPVVIPTAIARDGDRIWSTARPDRDGCAGRPRATPWPWP